MKVCIVGAGAIGGFFGARLAQAGQCQLGVLARGATLTALQQHGWRLQQGNSLLQAPAMAASEAGAFGVQDLVILAVKGPSLLAAALDCAPLFGPDTIVLPAMNGVPWWFGNGVAALGAAPLACIDPDACIANAIPQAAVVGCVVHASTLSLEPGLVQHQMGQRLILGEPTGGISQRVQNIGALFADAGFDIVLSDKIRDDIWYKLWGNLTMNPISALTGASIDRVLDDALVREFCSAAMREAAAIGEKIGCTLPHSAEERHTVTRKLGAFKSSLLQDVDAGRPLELDSIVAAVREMGQRVGVATPNIDALLGLTRLFARVHGLYPQA